MPGLILAGQRLTSQLLSTTVSTLATGSVSNSTAETVIGTLTIPAGNPSVGTGYRFTVFGSVDDAGTPALSVSVRLGGVAGTLIWNSGSLTCASGITGQWWFLDCVTYFTATGSGGTLQFGGTLAESYTTTSGASHVSGLTGVTVNTTAAMTLSITGKWGTLSPSNTVRTLGGSLLRLN